jgi:hypothetical protein
MTRKKTLSTAAFCKWCCSPFTCLALGLRAARRKVEVFLAGDRVRKALDAVYGEECSTVDRELAAMQRAAIGDE